MTDTAIPDTEFTNTELLDERRRLRSLAAEVHREFGFTTPREQMIRRSINDVDGELELRSRDDRTSPEERDEYAELRAEAERRERAALSVADLSQRIQQRSGSPKSKTFDDAGMTYRKHGDPKASWVRDVVMSTVEPHSAAESRERLARHAEEVRANPTFSGLEYRDLSRVDGQGGYLVPPAWLVDEWVEYARAGRTFANLLSLHPLPGGTDSINVPKILTGTATAIQVADNTSVQETDLTDTFINSPVRTIAGQQSVALQLIDQSPIAFDDVVLTDLTAAQAQNVDVQALYGTGTSGQIQGVSNWPGINTVAVNSVNVQGIYGAIAQAFSTIWSNRFAEPTCVVMHPRRWAWLLSLLDDNNRPLFLPSAQSPMNAAGIMANTNAQGYVGTTMGLPIFVDANLTTTAGTETPMGTEDVMYVMRASDIVLYESGLRARVLPQTLAGTLTVLIQVYSYISLAVRYPASIVEVTGLTPPTFG